MSKLRAAILLLLLVASGCGKSQDDAPQTISAPVDNTSPAAANAPSAPMGESPGELAARMGRGGGLKKGPR